MSVTDRSSQCAHPVASEGFDVMDGLLQPANMILIVIVFAAIVFWIIRRDRRAQSPQGVQRPKGDKGDTGSAGATGPTGAEHKPALRPSTPLISPRDH
jgi:hypothetical protein